MTLRVGDVVTVGLACMGNLAGAIALVVEQYALTDRDRRTGTETRRPGWSLLFENGAWDGFSPDDCVAFGVTVDHHNDRFTSYAFTTAGELYRDWRAGRFSSVWAVSEADAVR